MPNFELVPGRAEMSGFEGGLGGRTRCEPSLRRSSAIRSNRNTAMTLILLTERLGYTQAAAYRMVYPDRTCSDESAARHVRNLKAHHRKTHPLINQRSPPRSVALRRLFQGEFTPAPQGAHAEAGGFTVQPSPPSQTIATCASLVH